MEQTQGTQETKTMSPTEASRIFLSTWDGKTDLAMLTLSNAGQMIFGGLAGLSILAGQPEVAAVSGVLAVAERFAAKGYVRDISQKITAIKARG